MRIRGSFWVILKLAVVGNENNHIDQDDNDRPSYLETKATYFLKVYLSGDEGPWKILLLYSKSVYQWFTSPCRMKKKKISSLFVQVTWGYFNNENAPAVSEYSL